VIFFLEAGFPFSNLYFLEAGFPFSNIYFLEAGYRFSNIYILEAGFPFSIIYFVAEQILPWGEIFQPYSHRQAQEGKKVADLGEYWMIYRGAGFLSVV
jgi:hypothetical protein